MARNLARLVVGALVLSGVCVALKIGAFNIQTFGKAKMNKPDVVQVLLQIAERYDILLIQEIRDSTQTAIVDFLNQLNNRNGNDYLMLLSDRLGRTSYKEQYAFLYRNMTDLSHVDDYHYSDPEDKFEREPYIVRFQFKTSDFALIPLHAKPDDAVKENKRLFDVYQDVVDRWDIPVIILGDLNADCSYVGSSDWSSIPIRGDSQFNWLIADYADTTVKSTHCAYDRLVVAGDLQFSLQSASVFDFKTAFSLTQDEAEDVSDHFPVEMELS